MEPSEDPGHEHSKDLTRFVFFGLCTLSISGLLIIAGTIIFNKKLQAHPQHLIAYICIAEACMSYNALILLFGPTYISCYFKYDYVFALTFGIVHPSEDDLKYFLNILCISNGTTF